MVDRRVYIQQSAGARDPEVVLRLFVFMARHGDKLAMETERRLNNARRALHDTMPQDARLWTHLRELLVQPHAAEALRSMHSLRLLAMAVPEFETIDSLVLRDLYHRYTVDEHTFLAIDTLHRLRENGAEWLQPFADLFSELERPELLFLALLFHDTGKGLAGSDHVHGSLQLALAAVERLGLGKDDAQTVGFLIATHLEMSSTLAAARHLRPGDRPRTGRQDRNARTAEDAHPDDAGRHQGSQSRGAHSVEGRKSVAAVYRHRQLLHSQCRRTAFSRRGLHRASRAHCGAAAQGPLPVAEISRWPAAALPDVTFARAGDRAL